MSWKRRQQQIKMRLMWRQNQWLFFLILTWELISGAILVASGHPVPEALTILLFMHKDETGYAYFYTSMTDFVVFGLVISVLLVDVQRQVRPETTCRVMAEELEGHAVIFHFSNLGKRAWQLFRDHDIPVAVVEPDPANLEELIREGYPCVVGTGRAVGDLETVNIGKAKLVFIACDDLETLAVVSSLVRQQNPRCALIARCYEDDIGDVLGKRYRATIVSTSKLAAKFIKEYASKQRSQRCILFGCGQLSRRLLPILQSLNMRYTIVCEKRSEAEDISDEHPFLFGKWNDRDLLKQAGIGDCDLAILTDDDLNKALTTVDEIRSFNTNCKVVCRVFHDDAADMLSAPPFNCDVISTSRYAVEQLRVQGAFKAVGLARPEKTRRSGGGGGMVSSKKAPAEPAPVTEESAEEPLQLVQS